MSIPRRKLFPLGLLFLTASGALFAQARTTFMPQKILFQGVPKYRDADLAKVLGLTPQQQTDFDANWKLAPGALYD